MLGDYYAVRREPGREETEQEGLNHVGHEYLKRSMFEDVRLPERIPPYEGKGATSFAKGYDGDKTEYLDQLGVHLPEGTVDVETGEVIDRSVLATMFVVTCHVMVLAEILQRGYDIDAHIPGINRKLQEMRMNEYGDREMIGDSGIRVEDVYRRHGFSCNPTLRVTQEELHEIVDHVFRCLRGQA